MKEEEDLAEMGGSIITVLVLYNSESSKSQVQREGREGKGQIVFGCWNNFMNKEAMRLRTVKAPPITAHIEVMKLYHGLALL
jgi:hypothetical protein